MGKLRKWWKAGVATVLVVVGLQVAVSFLVRTHRVHAYLTAHLERAFGRPVEVSSFAARIFPSGCRRPGSAGARVIDPARPAA